MDEPPDTVREALSGVEVEGRTCLEAGAGVGNATAGLLERDATAVLAVTNDPDHAATVRDRFADAPAVTTVRADLRSIPLPDGVIDIVTAHGLFNVVATTEASAIVEELTRVTAPCGRAIVDDYAPVPATEVRDLFALANAVGELDQRRPTFTFYPADHLRAAFEGHGWRHERTKTLLDPVPWTGDLLDEHAALIEDRIEALPEPVGKPLRSHLERVRARAGDGVETGELYSLAFELPA